MSSTEKFTAFIASYPEKLLLALLQVARRSGSELYFVGGTVRDFLLGRLSHDLDITVSCQVAVCARLLVDELGGGSIVNLSGPKDEAYRVVWQSQQVDFSAFRVGSKTIEGDLCLRDFTINAMAVHLDVLSGIAVPDLLLDPTGGLADLREGQIRHCPGSFVADPVRMLRGYRLAAILDFTLVEKTVEAIKYHCALIKDVAAERLHHELTLIFASGHTARTVKEMDETGLLAHLLPELYRGKGIDQPDFHHLDVLGHSFLALEVMELIIDDPEHYFPGSGEHLDVYLAGVGVVPSLKWAALLHDIGKPVTREVRDDKDGRVTFYRHDEVGRDLFKKFADRLKWSKVETKRTAGLIGMHMHPFHLCNVTRQEDISARAALKLCRKAGDDLPGLFLLAMSDSLASKGVQKPERMEEELFELYRAVQKIYEQHIEPVLHGPRLLNGKDLIAEFELDPGPLFAQILAGLEIAQVEGRVSDRQTACNWVRDFLQEKEPE
ncbi:MAG: CCA tRNA nucleotidyltransferase [Desulforhopalus sp.]